MRPGGEGGVDVRPDEELELGGEAGERGEGLGIVVEHCDVVTWASERVRLVVIQRDTNACLRTT